MNARLRSVLFLDHFWPSLEDYAWFAGTVLSVVGVLSITYQMGAASMAAIALDARGDADWCMSIVEPVQREAERAGAALQRSDEVVAAFLGVHPAPRVDRMVVR